MHQAPLKVMPATNFPHRDAGTPLTVRESGFTIRVQKVRMRDQRQFLRNKRLRLLRCLATLLPALCFFAFCPLAENVVAMEPDTNGYRIFTDMAGGSVKIPKRITRIGTLGPVPMLNSYVEALGAGSLIYNRPAAYHNIHGRWKMHLRFAPQIAEGPAFESDNHEMLLENIVAAKPDFCLVISRGMADAIERVGIPPCASIGTAKNASLRPF